MFCSPDVLHSIFLNNLDLNYWNVVKIIENVLRKIVSSKLNPSFYKYICINCTGTMIILLSVIERPRIYYVGISIFYVLSTRGDCVLFFF